MYDTYSTHDGSASRDIFTVKTANEWAAATRARPRPNMLFDEYWHEGELAVLFGDSGKSSLAVQIAESIAGGTEIEPMRMTAGAQPVLYVDLGQTDTQFGTRYLDEECGGYTFADDLHRAELRPDVMVAGSRGIQAFLAAIERKLADIGAKVLIVDSITHLRRSNYGTAADILLIRGLNRLKRLMNISILAVANADRRDTMCELTIHDLGPSRILGNFADTVFAVGQCGRRGPFRYLKHVRGYLSDAVYDEEHTPSFRLGRLETGLFGLTFDSFGPEIRCINRRYIEDNRETMEEVARLAAVGHSVREIAAELDISRSKAHRLHQMSTREDLTNDAVADEESEDGWQPVPFPGEEKYDEALADPRFGGIFAREDAEAHALRRESYLIEAAQAEARREYVENGTETTFEDMFARVSGGGSATGTDEAEDFEEHTSDPDGLQTLDPHPSSNGHGLKRKLDAYDRVIWVEREDSRGKHVIWYQRNKQDQVNRWERTAAGILGSIVTDEGVLEKIRAAEREFG